MAATFNESQKIDYLWKKVGYGVTKTAEVTSKEAFNESIASPLLYRGDLVWMESDKISGTPPAATSSIIQVYKDGVGSYSPSVECTEDLTAPDNQTWKTNLTNWVPTQFGDNYLIQVYVANSGVTNPQTSGTKLFQAGSGNDDTWFFDYQSGVLNFNGSNIPTQITGGITGKSVYIVGYRYVGLIGVTNQPSGNIASNTNIGNLNFTDTTISTITPNSNIYLAPNGVGNVLISTSLTSNGNFTVNGISNLGNVGNVKITGGTTGYLLQTDGNGNLSWFQPSSGSSIANGNSNVSIPNIDGNINLTAVGNTTMVIAGNGVNIQGYLTVTGTVTAGNINANVSSDTITANSANISGNLYVADTATIGNVRTDHILYANGQPWDLQEAAGANTEIQYNDGNTNFGASANFTFNQSTNLLTVVGNTQFNNANLGNLATANYANITGNLYVADTATIGNVRTDHILYANGSPWDLQEAAGANTQIQYNDGNTNFGASANFTFDQTTNILTVVGNANVGNFNATGTINATGNISGGNITTIGEVVATGNGTFNNIATVGSGGNITGANVVSANTFTASANINANNANLGNLVTSNYANISANLYVFDTASVGNLRTDHLLYANGSPWDLQEAAGANTQIQYNDGNTNFGASANFTFNYATNLLTVVGNVTANNFNATETITANGNVSGGNLVTTGTANIASLAISGNVTGNLVPSVNAIYDLGADGAVWRDLWLSGSSIKIGTQQITSNVGGVNLSNTVTAANVTATNTMTAVTINASGTITGANVTATTFTASANISANNANISANLYVFDTANVGNLRTDHLLYANGSPWDLQEAAGANTQIQFNDGNTNFGASANLTFDYATNLLTVVGNTQFNNANLGNLATANYVNISYQLDGNTANFSGNLISGNADLGNTSIANNVVANTFRMGVGVNEFYHSTVYFATTTSTDPNQVLWSTSMANLSAIDFTIISTDETSNTRQTAKIAAAVLGTDVVFNEYSGLYINGGVGSFSVNYQAGPPETIQLVVTPDSTNLTKYNMMIIQYAK